MESDRPGETVSGKEPCLIGTVNDFAHHSFLVLRLHVRLIVLRVYLPLAPPCAFLLPTSNPCLARSTRKLSPPVRNTPLGVSPIERDVARQLDCTADCVPEFGHFCPVVHELAVEVCRC